MSWSPTTSHWGAHRARAATGGTVEVTGHPDDPAPADLLRNADAVAHPTRVRAPAVRRGWLEGGGVRGSDEFVEVGWDTALDLVAEQLRRTPNEAVFAGSYGWASAGRFHHAQSQLRRFLNTIGGCTTSRNTYSTGTSEVLLPHLVGDADIVMRHCDTWDTVREHTDLVVAFGGLSAKNLSVTPGGLTRHSSAVAVGSLTGSGVELAVISPLADDGPPGARWYPVTPATDVALMLGLAHTLLAEDLHDREFLTTRCTGFDVFAEYLRGMRDGVAKTADWAAGICGLPADDIRALARRMAAGRTLVTVSWSLQRIRHGEQPVWAGLALAAMLGQIGLPGGGFAHGYGSMGDIGEAGPLRQLPTLPQGRNPVSSFIPVAKVADMLLHPGQEYDYDGQRRTFPEIRLVYWAGGNPFHHHQDLNRLRRAFAVPETIVVHEPHWTATARHADIVLPVTTTLEREDIGAGRRDTHLTAMHRILDPVGQARDDHDIFLGLAERLGTAEEFTEGRSKRQWLEHLYSRWRADLAAEGHDLPEFAEFWAAGQLRMPATPPRRPLAAFRRGEPLATPSGRIELFSETIAGFGYPDCPGHPTWLAPEISDRWPLRLIAHQPRTRLHSQGDVGSLSQESKVEGREPVRINPRDAAERGIAEGDVVRLFNDRGACLAGARLCDDVSPGVVVLATGAWFDPLEDPAQPGGTLCVHGNPNVLTADVPTSSLSQGCSGQQALVQVERQHGEAPPLRYLAPPRILGGDEQSVEA
ncbi:molybdopterin-dependent oxidoreductase [Saccharopolyspora taberi]|uniref:Molybdopterin guanine dinucleotide-containing S/N-oxide reductase n=1 Tax=Saccharopolyspora taberi TaxID=60895 RepID=A0ABN3VEJ5_9PSEU